MDEYDQFNPKLALRVALIALFGVGVAMICSIIGIWALNSSMAIQMVDMILQLVAMSGQLNPVLLIVLTFTFLNMVAPVAFIWANWFFADYMAAASITQVDFLPILLSSVLTWIITGILIGIVSKEWAQGLQNAFISGLLGYVINAFLVIFMIGQSGMLFSGIITYGVLYIAFVLAFIMSIPTFLLLVVSGVIGGLIARYTIYREEVY